jgi:hypothetical protein
MFTVPMQTADSRLELAKSLFRKYYSQCFWHYRPDLSITEAQIPLVVQGLRMNGGREGLLAAARLTAPEAPPDVCR